MPHPPPPNPPSYSSLLLNQNLERILSFLEQRHIFLLSLSKISSLTSNSKAKTLTNLEKVLEKARISHLQLRTRIEEMEDQKDRNEEKGDKGQRARIVKCFGKNSM